MVHRNQTICIAGIADHQNSYIRSSRRSDGAASAGEDRTVDANQVTSFHTSLTRNAADAQNPVTVFESILEVIAVSLDDTCERRKCTVVEFHVDTIECLENWRNFDQMQNHWLIRSEDLPRRNAINQ